MSSAVGGKSFGGSFEISSRFELSVLIGDNSRLCRKSVDRTTEAFICPAPRLLPRKYIEDATRIVFAEQLRKAILTTSSAAAAINWKLKGPGRRLRRSSFVFQGALRIPDNDVLRVVGKNAQKLPTWSCRFVGTAQLRGTGGRPESDSSCAKRLHLAAQDTC